MPDTREDILLKELEKLRRENKSLRSHARQLEIEKHKLESDNQKLKDFPQDTVERIYDVYISSAFTCFKLTDPGNIPDTKEAEPFIKWHLTNLSELIGAYAILKKKELDNFALNKGVHLSLSAKRDISGTSYDSVRPGGCGTAPGADEAVCEIDAAHGSDDNVNVPGAEEENLSAAERILAQQERLSASLLSTAARLTELENRKKNPKKAHKEQNTQPEPEQEPKTSKDCAADDKSVVTEDGTGDIGAVFREIEIIKTHGAPDGSTTDFKSANRKNTGKSHRSGITSSLDREHITHIRPKKLEVFCPHCWIFRAK